MYLKLLNDPRLYPLLCRFDDDLAAQVRDGGCDCGDVLHSASYPRKPRGLVIPEGDDCRRHSFCCARDGCRARSTPPSVRFLGRRVYFGVVVTLMSAMNHGASPRRVHELRAKVGADRRTLSRWRAWWREEFVTTTTWRASRGRLMPTVAEDKLPSSLLDRLGGGLTGLCRALGFLLPLTTTESCSVMPGFDPQKMLVALR